MNVRIEQDQDYNAPWIENDGHGPVTEWTRRDKKPGELVLCDYRGSKRFYDFQAAVKQAKRESWGIAGQTFKTRGEQAAAAAMADYQYLRGYCNGDWHYVGVIVEDGKDSVSSWGIESNDYDYIDTVTEELKEELQRLKESKLYPVTEWGL